MTLSLELHDASNQGTESQDTQTLNVICEGGIRTTFYVYFSDIDKHIWYVEQQTLQSGGSSNKVILDY